MVRFCRLGWNTRSWKAFRIAGVSTFKLTASVFFEAFFAVFEVFEVVGVREASRAG